jgi:hypothetical protein
MKPAKLLALIGLLAMTFILFYGFTYGDFFEDGKAILNNPWGLVSLVDLYVGFILFSMWIAYREKNILYIVFWIFLMMTLGFFAGSLYVLINIYKAKGDPKDLLLGYNHRK